MGRKFIDLTGKKFGKLTVIEIDENRYISPKYKKKSVRWLCECECGKKVSIIGDCLRSGSTSQCKKCQYKEKQLNGYISANCFHHIKNGAKRRNIYFDPTITREYLWELFIKQNKKCKLTNLEIHFTDTLKEEVSHRGRTASLDRKDNSKGYIKDNIQWVHKDINWIKGTLDQQDLIHICKDIWRHCNEKK